MKRLHIALSLVTLLTASTPYAKTADVIPLEEARRDITTRYLQDLQNRDYRDITSLFDKNGYVISTGRGVVNAKEFFYAFLPNITSASTAAAQTFIGEDHNRLAVRFEFNFTLKSGEAEKGVYMDEFIFAEGSTKLMAVYMFENTHFHDGA
jgi:hypothetical protein